MQLNTNDFQAELNAFQREVDELAVLLLITESHHQRLMERHRQCINAIRGARLNHQLAVMRPVLAD